MENHVAINLIGNCIYSTIFVLLICGNEANMTPWWVTLTVGIVPAILTCLVTLYISHKSQLHKMSDEIKTLSRQLGLDDKQAMSYKFEEQYNRILMDIGKTNEDRSLTGQHKDMQSMLQKGIDTAERRYNESEARIRNFTAQQHNMAETINQFRLFMESWERLASENSDLKHRIIILENQIEELSQHSMNAADRNFTEVQEGGDGK